MRALCCLCVSESPTMTARVQWQKKSGRDPQGAWSQHELIGGKSTFVK
jgi:hypothetical protein